MLARLQRLVIAFAALGVVGTILGVAALQYERAIPPVPPKPPLVVYAKIYTGGYCGWWDDFENHVGGRILCSELRLGHLAKDTAPAHKRREREPNSIQSP